MKIALDIDDVLSESGQNLIDFYNNLHATEKTLADIVDFNLATTFKITLEQADVMLNDWYLSPFFPDMKVREGAQEAVSYLAKKHTLYSITSRPFEIEHLTIQWLDKHFPDTFVEITHTNSGHYSGGKTGIKKSDVCKRIGATVIVEDNVKYANDCAENGITTFLMERPWNKGQKIHPDIIKVKDWSDFLKKFKKKFSQII